MAQKSTKNALANYVKKLGRRVAAIEAKLKTNKKNPRETDDEEPDDNEEPDDADNEEPDDDEDGGADETSDWP